MKKVALHTLGCKLNFSETATIGRQFEDKGYEPVSMEEVADIYVINTCSVTENADKKCKHLVKDALKMNPKAQIFIVGCYAQLKPQEIADIEGVTAVFGASDKFRVTELLDTLDTSKSTIYHSPIEEMNEFVPTFSSEERTRAFLKVQDGCDYKCSFCTIPLARGKSRSDTVDNVLDNIQKLANQGINEIVLSGINLGDFRLEKNLELLDLLKVIDKECTTISRFRLSSIEPNLLSNEIIAFVAESDRFMPHFHIPLQSGSNKILALMRRRYKKELYKDRTQIIKELIPNACIGVDVIVGFPNETEADFLETYSFLNELDITYLHVFPYSERANTSAIELEGVVPQKIRQQRSQQLRQLSQKKRRYFNQQFVGQSLPVLFERKIENNLISGFTNNYIRVNIPYHPSLINQVIITYLLSQNADLELIGEPVRVTQNL